MRILPFLTAALVAAFLYLLVFERDRLLGFASTEASAVEVLVEEDTVTAEPAIEDDGIKRVHVVAVRSSANEIGSAVQVRGRTQAARQVDVQAETAGQVISEPLRKGSFVNADDMLCQLDPGTRASSLSKAQASLAEAHARVPESEARVIEARALLAEAEINDRAALRLSQDGFASETRVAATTAAVQSALVDVSAAQSGLSAAKSGIQSAEADVAAAEKEIERLSLTAPFAGILESDTAELGTLLQNGAHCATIIQLDPIKLVGFVPEVDVDRVVVGVQAGARLISGREVQGRVTFLSRSADITTRTFQVEVTVPNIDLAIRDGQTADILIASEGTVAHLLPGSAMTLNHAGALGVRVVDADSKAQFMPVTLLRDTTEGVLLGGLTQEAIVIVVGQEFVIDGVPVDVTYRETN